MRGKLAGSAASLLVLTACGGGGDGYSPEPIVVNPGPSPVPAPSPSPSPPPSPTPSPTTGEIKPSANSQSVAVVHLLTVDESASTTSDRSVREPGGQFSITYNDAARTYTLQNELRTRTFGPSELVRETSVPDFFPRVQWQRSDASTDDFLVIFKQSNSSPVITIQHAAYGAWQQNERLPGKEAHVRLDYFIYGTPTAQTSLPQSGVVTYRWAGTGNYAENARLYFAESSGTMRVDFGARTFEVNISMTGTDFFGGNFGGLIGFVGRGTISGGALGGPLEFTFPTYSGTLRGTFYGPNAEEVGVVYSGAGERSTLGGAFMGTRN